MADILPLEETDEQVAARIERFLVEGGEDLLTEEELAMIQPDAPQVDPNDHYANLAEFIPTQELTRIAQDVVEWEQRDEEARREWYEREQRGMVLMGLTEDKKYVAPFKGATTATHPLLAEACINFQARAIAELWPAGGPVKTIIMGVVTDETRAQSGRVREFMNHQYTQVNGGYDEEDRMLARLPMSGSCFKKQYFDPQTGVIRSDYVEAADFLVPYSASSLKTSPRYMHRMPNTLGNDIKKLMRMGFYKKWEKEVLPVNEGDDNTEVHDAIDEAEGRDPVDYEDAGGYTLLECNCFLDLPGFEDPDGIAWPYVVTVEKYSQTVLAIRRGWRKNDPLRERRVQVTHYKFLPGFGFYGFGFVHAMGGLSQTATGVMRAYLDAAGLANMKGGFRSRDAKLEDDSPLGMGEWREADMTAEELAKCFFPMEYKEPSKGLFEMLGFLDQSGRRFASMTENLTGDANNNGPVGTTLALIEQGLKVFSGIHKRLHEAHAVEFRIMSDLYGEFLPEEYPYMVEEAESVILRADFDERVDVIPVSDPNVSTNTQRITQSQSVVELAGSAPDLYDMQEVHRRMLNAMQVPKVEELFAKEGEIPPMDPVTEGMMMFTNQGVQAYPEQDHFAHMAAHQNWWDQMVPEELRKDLEPIYKAHQADHLAHSYKIQVMQQLGIDPMEAQAELQDPAIQNMIAQGAAELTNLMAPDTLGIEEPEFDDAAAESRRKDEQVAADIERKDAAAMATIERDDAKAYAEIERAATRDRQEAVNEAREVEATLARIESGE